MIIYMPLTEDEMLEMYRSDVMAFHDYRMCKPVEVPEELYYREDLEKWLKEQVNEPSVQD